MNEEKTTFNRKLKIGCYLVGLLILFFGMTLDNWKLGVFGLQIMTILPILEHL